MPWSDYLALLALLTAMSFTPGPNTMLSTALAANRGLKVALGFALAVPVGWCALMLACALGVGTLVQAVPALRLAVKWGGLAYLLWLAWQLAQAQSLKDADPTRLRIGFWQGAALQWVNIKAWMAALLVAAGWVAPGPLGERLLVVLPTMTVFAFCSNATYAVVGATLRPWLAQGGRLLAFNRGMAGVLLATTVWMGWST
ncbi:LysE family translocator [Ideonella livida]|uniref:LysE family translocator n=1 Tax=Ideonella livida TaxID=2707176 RepID=A0A7C9TKD6_9BURK|nr:LysE family translocator [Ideonella livida]NDY92398.1 LysE family translocator [Ideonella livida]